MLSTEFVHVSICELSERREERMLLVSKQKALTSKLFRCNKITLWAAARMFHAFQRVVVGNVTKKLRENLWLLLH